MFGSTSLSKEKQEEVIEEICRRLFQEAEPGMDYDKVETPRKGDTPWYDLHYMEDEKQKQVMRQVCQEMNVPESDRDDLISAVLLQYGPNSHRPKVAENREQAGLEPISSTTDREVDE